MQIGFVGLGRMGKGMASNWSRKGFRLVVHDINRAAVAELEALQARGAESAAQVAQEAPVVVTMLPNSAVVAEIVGHAFDDFGDEQAGGVGGGDGTGAAVGQSFFEEGALDVEVEEGASVRDAGIVREDVQRSNGKLGTRDHVTFTLFVRPVLARLQGALAVAPEALPVRADFAWPRPDKRREFLRVKRNASGGLDLYRNQGSGVLTSLAWGDGLADIAPGQAVQPGDLVRYLSLAELAALTGGKGVVTSMAPIPKSKARARFEGAAPAAGGGRSPASGCRDC